MQMIAEYDFHTTVKQCWISCLGLHQPIPIKTHDTKDLRDRVAWLDAKILFDMMNCCADEGANKVFCREGRQAKMGLECLVAYIKWSCLW